MKGSLLQNWASIHLHYGGQFTCLYTHHAHSLAGGGGDTKVQNGFPGTRTLMNSPSLPPRQTEQPIPLGPAVCQCLGDDSRRRLLGMGQIQGKTRRFLPRGLASARVICRMTSSPTTGRWDFQPSPMGRRAGRAWASAPSVMQQGVCGSLLLTRQHQDQQLPLILPSRCYQDLTLLITSTTDDSLSPLAIIVLPELLASTLARFQPEEIIFSIS